MLGFLKTFVRKLVTDPPAQNPAPETEEAQPAGDAAEFDELQAPHAPSASNRGGVPNRNGHAPQNGKGVQVPLQGILATLPLELQAKVLQSEVGNRTISIPLEKILAQLSRGTITISFGELRQAAPDVFAAENDRDKVLVLLPLSEVLARLNPALITRRRVQRTVEVPDEISSPFDAQGNGLVFSTGPSKAAEPAPAPASSPQPPQHAQPFQPFQAAPARSSLASTPTPQPPASSPMISATRALREQAAPKTPGAPASIPMNPIPMNPIPMNPFQRAPSPKPSGDANRPSMAPAAAPASKAGSEPPLLVAITALAEAWPDAVRKEIVEANLVDAKVALPTDSVKKALKQGRIAFSWKTLRSWINATVAPVSPNDGVVLELPLKVVAPLFLTRQQEDQKAQHKVSIDVEIPNLFFGFPQAEGAANAEVGGAPPPAAAARPSDTNYYVWDDNADTARVDVTEVRRTEGPGPGTRFVAKYATPNEVVSRAAALEGIAGALIALPDGLMVANQLPADVNADTIAAFLPQIFSKVSSCTKELRMGDLNNLNFTIGNIPWKIFRVNAIYFAAFGRAGQPLPTAQLAALAAELDHKPK